MRSLISFILLCSVIVGSASASEQLSPQQINEMCFDLGTTMGEVISKQRSLGADVSTSAAVAANQYAWHVMPADMKRDPTVEETVPYTNAAMAYADEIYKLNPRAPETMGVYLYFVCQLNALMGRDIPSDQPSLDQINALLGHCETESQAQQNLIQCVGTEMSPLVEKFPIME